MMNSSLGGVDATQSYHGYNNTNDSYKNPGDLDLGGIALMGLTLITCYVGLVGNGYIIWLLGFQMKRNCFTTFILNLAVADFGYLVLIFIYYIYSFFSNFEGNKIFHHFCAYFVQVMYVNANFLLTAISIDRCVAVLFPIWHHCSRPKHLTSSVCLVLWIFSFLLSGIMRIMKAFVYRRVSNYHFLVTAIICLPLITISTVVLFIKVRLKSNQSNRGRLLLTISITLLCFLTLAFPLCVFVLIINFSNSFNNMINLLLGTILLSCLNSSINPVIYFLVGRKGGVQFKMNLKAILQNAFKESEATGGDRRAQTHFQDF